jgi:para-aminobenzoate synthetase component 1
MKKINYALLQYPEGKAFLCLDEVDALVGKGSINWLDLDDFLLIHQHKFIVSFLGYDIKNSIEKLESANENHHDAPDWVYFVPKTVYQICDERAELVYGEPQEALMQELLLSNEQDNQVFSLKPAINKDTYINQVNLAKEQIQLGNCYELNFCQNFQAFGITNLNTWSVFRKMLRNIQAPFSAYLQWNEHAMMGSSPELFLKKNGSKLVSQPIKGTRPRKNDPTEDEKMKIELMNDIKERAENVMIVDLVRNDLTRVAKTGTIRVEELFGIYSFNTVHQMISTISCQLKDHVKYSEIIHALFPMGSMTGAPKIAAMRIIEGLESFQRGWYSGSIGLIHPNGDFDMNVVIRSLLYNEKSGYLCCPVGSAITILSDSESEYQECLVKIKRILSLFEL